MKRFKEIKFKELIFNNFPLKILAVIIAIILWIVIANVDNPSSRKNISGINVNVKNGEMLENMGYIYQVESGGTISINVKAPRSVLNELRSSDFDAYADLSERASNSDKVKIHVSCNKTDVENQIDIVSVRPEYLQISIDNMVSKELQLTLNVTGEPQEGFVIGDYYTSPGSIRISGAASVVDNIVSAGVYYNVDNMKTNVDDTVTPVFYDASGNEVKSDKLELSRDDVKIHIDILPTKWVPVHYAVTGEPAQGYKITGYTANMESVNVAASAENLDKISSIDIPVGTIDFTGLNENKVFEVPLASYLPTGYRIVSSESILRVSTAVEQYVDREIELRMSDVEVKNLDDGLMCHLESTGGSGVVKIKIRGIQADIEAADSKSLGASVSLEGRKKGTYVVSLTFAGSETYEIIGNYFISADLTEVHENETESDQAETITEDSSKHESLPESGAEPDTENE